jgi:tRNA 2-thiouridine synthesizing protein A
MANELDARGLLCPLPVLKARKALKAVPVGDTLAVLTTDAGAPQDFVHFCATTGNELIGTEQFADHARITIRRLV